MKALVLCAGYGTRLGELTRTTPKPMLPIGGRPLLEYILRHLARHGFRNILINLHHRPDAIRDHFGDGAALGLSIRYVLEDELLGTAGTIRENREFLAADGRPFLVHYGDILTDQDLGVLVSRHRSGTALATLLLHRRVRSNSIVRMDAAGRITAFIERPARHPDDGPTWVHSCISLCRPELIDHIPPPPADLARDVFVPLAARGRLQGVPLTGTRFAIDSVERLEEARRHVREHWPRPPAFPEADNGGGPPRRPCPGPTD